MANALHRTLILLLALLLPAALPAKTKKEPVSPPPKVKKKDLKVDKKDMESDKDLKRHVKHYRGEVFIEGFVGNIHEAIKDAEMFVLSSDYEGLPNALLEAMMMGLPCVTTSFESAEELFGDSDSCLMVPVGDETALSDAMSRMAEDERLREALSTKASKFTERFSMERVIPLWEKEL